MLIGELSKRSGLSRDTIRFYEKNELISVSKKARRENNYKEYSEETLHRLQNIKLVKSFGFTLNEVSEMLVLIDINEAKCNTVLDMFDDKVKRIDEKIRELLNIRTLLLSGREKCKNACCHAIPESNCVIVVA